MDRDLILPGHALAQMMQQTNRDIRNMRKRQRWTNPLQIGSNENEPLAVGTLAAPAAATTINLDLDPGRWSVLATVLASCVLADPPPVVVEFLYVLTIGTSSTSSRIRTEVQDQGAAAPSSLGLDESLASAGSVVLEVQLFSIDPATPATIDTAEVNYADITARAR